MNENKLPFLFARINNIEAVKFGSTPVIRDQVVKIASHHDLKIYDAGWMVDEEFGELALVPDVDLCESVHIFPDYKAARQFVKDWWKVNYCWKLNLGIL